MTFHSTRKQERVTITHARKIRKTEQMGSGESGLYPVTHPAYGCSPEKFVKSQLMWRNGFCEQNLTQRPFDRLQQTETT